MNSRSKSPKGRWTGKKLDYRGVTVLQGYTDHVRRIKHYSVIRYLLSLTVKNVAPHNTAKSRPNLICEQSP